MKRLPSKDDDDLAVIKTLEDHLSGKASGNSHGTLLSYMAAMQASENPGILFKSTLLFRITETYCFVCLTGEISLPAQFKIVNLKAIGRDNIVYNLVFEFLKEHWKLKVKLVTPTSRRHGEIFMGNDVKSYTYVYGPYTGA
jgi:hypothetical protein